MIRLIFSFLIFICGFCASAQNLTDVSFELKIEDLTAKRNPVLDRNGNACALLKVIAPRLDSLEFEGNYVVKVENKELYYNVWLANGAKRITLWHKDYLPLAKAFETPLEANCTYHWKISAPKEYKRYELIAKPIEELPNDLSAIVSKRLDLNDELCALIKVQAPMLDNLDIRCGSGVVGDIRYEFGEYYVYVPRNTQRLTIRHPDFEPTTIEFGMKVQSLKTYKLLVEVHQITE